jgi:hypothetical protein
MIGKTGYGLLVGVWLAALAACRAGAAEPDRMPLQLELGQKAITSNRLAVVPKIMAFQETMGTIDLGFGPLNVKVTGMGRHVINVDVDGDGRVSKQEQAAIGPDDVAALTFTRPGDQTRSLYRVLFTHVKVDTEHGAIKGITAQCHPDYAWRAVIGKTPIRLIDDNLDGKITQDGQDAIVIGSSPVALPLVRTHVIDGKEYDLEVAEGAKTVAVTPRDSGEWGKVALPFRTAALRFLVLRSNTHAYDVAGGATVPPGNYKLAYGLLTQGSERTIIAPGRDCPAYPIKADHLNILKIGPPFMVFFDASIQNDKVSVSPPLSIVGAGCEQYRVVHPVSERPKVTLLAGRRLVFSNTMNYDKENLLSGYGDRVLNIASGKDWQIQVRVQIPGMPIAAVGARTVREVLEETPQTIKVPREPVRYMPLAKERSAPTTQP